MNTHPEILAAHKAHIEAARKLMEAVQLAHPKGTRVKVSWFGKTIIGKVVAHSYYTNQPRQITVMNEKTGKNRAMDATDHKIEILP